MMTCLSKKKIFKCVIFVKFCQIGYLMTLFDENRKLHVDKDEYNIISFDNIPTDMPCK